MAWNISMPQAEWYDHDSPDLPDLIQEIDEDVRVLAIDTETTGLGKMTDYPLFWSLSWGNRRMCLDATVLQNFKPVFDNPDKQWVFANAKFDMHMLANRGLTFAGDVIDTQVMHALLYEDMPHGLKYMANHVLGWKWSDFTDTFKIGKGVKKAGFATIQDALMWCYHNDRPKLIEYASNDAYGTFQIYLRLKQELEEAGSHSLYGPDQPAPSGLVVATMWDYFRLFEKDFTKVLWECERNGALIDQAYLQAIETPVAKEVQQIEREIVKLVGHPINPNSTDDMRKYFFEEEGFKPKKMTKGGKKGIRKACLDESVLDKLAYDHPVAKLMLEHREVKKLLSTYVRGLAGHVGADGRIHCRFNQDIARTGRLSSADPNLQNVPNPEKDKHKIREGFIAPDGYDIICYDYDQLEMKLLACASLEESMIDNILAGRDIHMGNAALVFGPIDGFDYDEIAEAKKIDKQVKNGKLPKEALTDRHHQLLRRRLEVKTIGFGLNYGMKARKLGRDLGIPTEDAQELIDQYMKTYPAVKNFFDEAVAEVEQTGYAWTILGRRRFLPDILSHSEMDQWQAERQATNTPIQGSAADVVKLGMLRLWREADLENRFGCRMLLQVHDELVFECPKETVEEVKPIIREMMEHPFPTELAVPLTTSVGVGRSWGDTH